MSRVLTLSVSTIYTLAITLAITLLFMSVAEPAAADRAEITPGSLNFEAVSPSAAIQLVTARVFDTDDNAIAPTSWTWESSNENVATVWSRPPESGQTEPFKVANVSAVGEGTATITFTAETPSSGNSPATTVTATSTVTVTLDDARLVVSTGDLIFTSLGEEQTALEVATGDLIFTSLGETRTVSVRVYDENNNEIEDAPFSAFGRFDLIWPDDGGPPTRGGAEWRKVPGGLEVTALGNGGGSISIEIANGQRVRLLVYVDQVPTTLTVTPDSLSLDEGETATLRAAMTDANGHAVRVGDVGQGGMLVRWETSDSAVATVEGSLQDYYGYEAGGTATVTAIGEGAVTITASWLGLTATVTGTTTMSDRSARSTPAGATLTKQVGVMVAAREIPDGARLEVSPAELRFSALGETQTLSIRIYDENGDEIEDPSMQVTGLTSLVWPDDPDDTEPVGGPVEWRTVPGGLEVTALGNGSGRISIMDMANGQPPFTNETAQIVNVPISVRQIPTTFTVTPESLNLVAGEAATLQAAMTDANGHEIDLKDVLYPPVAWETSDSAVATVEGSLPLEGSTHGDSASVTAVAAGSATITARYRGWTTSENQTTSVETLVSPETATQTSANTAPVGLPAISGTPQVGETLTASALGITDADGLTNATYAWQWTANDGTGDADIAGATEATYTLTSAEVGKTVKVRATFTDDRGTEETVLSDATAAVEAAVPPAIVASGLQVTSAPQAASDTYGPGETIELTVTFDKAVTVDTTGGMPRIQFRLGPPRTDRWAEYSGGSGNTALTFTYEVQSGDMDSNGIWLPKNELHLRSGTIRDAATNTADAALSYARAGLQSGHKVDGSLIDTPVIVAGGVQVTSTPQAASDTYGPGETIELTVTFDKAVTVDTTGGMPRIQFRLGPPRTDRWAEYSGGSGNTALTFTYEVQSGDMDSNGIWLPKNELHLRSGTIRDAATNTADAALSYARAGLQSGHKVDGSLIDTSEVSISAANDTTNTLTRSVTAQSNSVTEGTAAVFTLTRTGSLADALTVNVGVTETVAMLNGAPPATVTFDADSATAELRVETDDDEVDESASVITADLASGSGYSMDAGASSAAVTVEDDDAAPVVTTASPVEAVENGTAITTLAATDDDTPAADLAWSIVGGSDSAKFTLSAGGDLAFAAAKDFEAPDDADRNGNYEVTVRVTDGANPVDAAFTVRLADVDEIAPVLSSANVDGDALTLTFDEALDGNSVPDASAFSVAVDGTARGVSGVSMSGSSVTLTLASAVVSDEAVTVGYTAPAGANAHPLRDVAGNPVAGFSDEAVTNDTPASNAAPTGLPAVSGTPQVGEPLTASIANIADVDGLTNAIYVWQWIANDGTSDAVIAAATAETYTLTSAEAGKNIKVRVTFTDDGGTEETLVSDPTAAVNSVPTGLPMISGTAQVGEALAASTSGIADTDGLTNAAFAWQWIANDGTSDADIAGATGAEYTLTSAEEGKTIKVRVTFTDDGGTEETLVSEATAAVTVALPSVSVAAVSSPVTEGTAASFTLRRTGDRAAALTVAVSVTEEGAVVSGTAASTVTLAAGSAEATLSVATVDDGVAETDARVTVAVTAGSGYQVDSGAGSAWVDVYDNDKVVSTSVKTLWTSTIEWQDDYGNGWVNANEEDFSSPGWSEDGQACRIWYIAYGSASREMWLRVNSDFCADGISEPETLTLQVGGVTVGPGDALSNFARRGIGIATGVEANWTAGEQIQLRLTRTEAGQTVSSGPGISVEDAQVREAEGAALAFRVTLDAAQSSAVSVRYATSDGTATAGADYESVSGALRFEAGETAKTVSVPVLNDAHDEGSETLTLALSRPFGAELADGAATGTIVNTGPMPQAWITRFGRTVGLQAIEAIGDRLSGAGGTEVVVGGVGLSGLGAYAGTALGEKTDWPMGPEDEAWSPDDDNGRGMTSRELLLGSSFQFGAGGEDGAPSLTAWGRVARSSFDGEEAGMSLSGDVTTGFLGADFAHDSWLAGLAVGVSEGEGSFDDGAGDGGGTVESSLTSVFPYTRFGLGDGVDMWGLVGIGSGDLKLTVGEEEFRTDLSMRMGALGLRGEVVPAEEAGDIELAVKTDAMWVRTESDAARSSIGGNLEAASGDASRVRIALEGSRAFATGPGATFTPTVELGLRHDTGDAETGTGVEVAAGLRYVDPGLGLTVEGNVRGLLTHSDDGYEEWGASGSVRLDPGVSGRGASLTIAPVWGAASGGVEQLWSTGATSGLALDDEFKAEGRLQTELGYGLRPPVGHGVLTPYTGLSLGEADSRMYRIGVRWNVGPQAWFSLDGNREETSAGSAPTDTMMLRAAVRF